MPKSERDLQYAIADKIGGTLCIVMREKLGRKTSLDRFLDRLLTDEDFAHQLKSADEQIRRYGQCADLPPLFGEVLRLGEKPLDLWQSN